MIDFIFLADVVVGFMTTYVNPSTGDEIWSPAMIAKNYACSPRFWFDLLSSMPFDYYEIEDGFLGDIMSTISILKIVRVTRISRIISNLNVMKNSKAAL
jgi:hypothetical protein